jgi:nucleoside 2-deoxyribosyltransferase
MRRAYVASGLGFSLTTTGFYYDVLLPKLEASGVLPLDPWSQTEGGAGNEQLLTSADGVFAVLDGTDVDSGTAAEIGWGAARGLPVVGWRSDIRRAGERDDVVVNLQVQYFVERHGGGVFGDLDAAIARLAALVGARPNPPGAPGATPT